MQGDSRGLGEWGEGGDEGGGGEGKRPRMGEILKQKSKSSGDSAVNP